jgi:hypothetical protein
VDGIRSSGTPLTFAATHEATTTCIRSDANDRGYD